MARTLLIESIISSRFWVEAISIACYIIDRVFFRPILEKTPYEVYKGKKSNVSYLHIFGCKCFILKNPIDLSGKFKEKSDKGIFLDYSITSKAYRVFNKKTQPVEESTNIKFEETQPDQTQLGESEPVSDFTKSTSSKEVQTSGK